MGAPPAVPPLGHTDASLLVPPSPQHRDVGKGGKQKSDGGTAIMTKFIPFLSCSFSIELSLNVAAFGPL